MAVAAARLASVWAMVVVIGCTRDEAVTANRCAQLRDHVIDTKLKTLANVGSASAIATTGSDRRASEPISASEVANHRAALQQALGEPYIANCVKNVASRQLTCALAASDAASLTACLATSRRDHL